MMMPISATVIGTQAISAIDLEGLSDFVMAPHSLWKYNSYMLTAKQWL
jgi:hypothetical protein